MKPRCRCSLSAFSAGVAGLLSQANLSGAFARHTDPSARGFDARGARPRSESFALALLLFIFVFALFSPSLRYELVDLDDIAYISNNTAVLEGFSPSAARQAFSLRNTTATMYMPLLWISYILDIEWLGAAQENPRGFHFTNVLLHAVNSVLVYLLLLAFCRKPWRALFFAAVWALHPLRVESVAWVAERKDVLSGFFALLCIGAYCGSRRPSAASSSRASGPGRLSGFCLFTALLFFALGLLVKPALAPIPFVLLLLDFWPLRRWEFTPRSARNALPRLLVEKVPFFLLAGLAAAGTVWGHRVVSGEIQIPLWQRIQSIPLAYGYYLLKTVLPRNLTVLYLPFSSWMSPFRLFGVVLLASCLLLAVTTWVWRSRPRAPHQLAGWLWFVGMLVPVCGIIPIPSNDVADRFGYLPAIGLSVAWLYLFPSRSSGAKIRRWWRVPVSLAILAGCALLTLRQLPVWKNTASLYNHVLNVFPDHATALKNRAMQLILDTGDFRHADALISKALRAEPRHWEAHFAKAQCLCELEGPAAAQQHLLGIVPPTSRSTHAYWRRDLARYALMLDQPEKALRHVDQALSLLPPQDLSRLPIVLLGMAAAYEKGDMSLALSYARRFPTYADRSSLELADLLPHFIFQWVAGYRRDAYAFFQRLVQAYPDRPNVLNNIAWVLATAKWSPADPQEVLDMASQLSALVPVPHPGILDTLAAAHANAGDYESARRTIREALALFPPDATSNQLLLKARLASRLALYEQQQPYREDAFTRMYVAFFGDPSKLRPPEPR